MRFGVLGSLEVVDDHGRPLDLGGSQSRTILAVLLVAAGRVVTAESIVDVVWGEDPPASAAGTLQSYVSRLRRALEPGRGRGEGAKLLLWEPPGYRLAVEPSDVDFRRFERLADEGRSQLAAGRYEDARSTLIEADGLWRGPALVEYRDREFGLGPAARLEERRLAAVEDRVHADLALGRHAGLVGELAELVRTHPLREGLRGQLALALYRSGRQAEALRALADARTTLRDELGIEPGRELRDLESAIFEHDPALDAPVGRVVAAATPAVAPATPGLPGHRLVGRAAELAQLVTALDEARGGLRVALLEGEPGIGKTRLAEEVAAEAARREALVLWGRTFEGGAAPAFWPWLPALRTLVAAAGRGAAGTVAPEVAALLAPTAAEGAVAPADAGRFVLVDAVAALLAERAEAGPVVIVLDDLQWADVESLELLVSLVGRLSDTPLLVVVTVRELEVGRNDAVVDALAALSRCTGTRRLRLRGLTREATAALVTQTAGDGVDPAEAAAIHARAEGNPFFATELARLLASGEGIPAADVPSGVRDVVRRRLAGVPEATAALLRVAAVVGRDVDLGLLARAAALDLDACLDALEPAAVQRLLVPAPDQPGAYRFAHALVREVLVDDVSTLRRARLHLQVADALDDVDDNAEILADHLWQAVPIGVVRRAAAALERAARVAMRRMAYASAQDLLERAVQLRRSAGSDQADLDAELQTVALLVSVVGARQGYPALVGSPLVARGKRLAEQSRRTLELLNLLWVEWAGLDVSCQFDKADPIAEELLARSKDTDVAVAPILGHTAYGIRCWHHGALTESAQHLDTATAAAEAVPGGGLASFLFDLDQLRLSSPFAVYIHDLIGDVGDATARYEELMRRMPGDGFWELLVSNFAASGALSVGDLPRAERAARRGLEADPEGISAFWSMAARAYLGAAVALQGDLGTGLPMLDEAWGRYVQMGLRTNGVTLLASRAHARARPGGWTRRRRRWPRPATCSAPPVSATPSRRCCWPRP
ncbi:MAG: BTAD domain-containing putative transcriptional regulator [Acidimicrobiia bacterium]